METQFKYKVILKIKSAEGLPVMCPHIFASSEIIENDEQTITGKVEPQNGQVKWEKDNVLAKLTMPHQGIEEVIVRLREDVKNKPKSLAKIRLDFAEFASKVRPGRRGNSPLKKN